MGGPRVVWIVVTLVIIAVTQAGVAVVRARYEPQVVRPLRCDVTDLPSVLGEWTLAADVSADEVGMDPKVIALLATEQAMTRLYEHPSGRRCAVHIAVWSDPGEWTPHPPELCYDGAGYVLLERSMVDLPGRDKQSARRTRFGSAGMGREVHAIYWYQIDNRTYVDRGSARSIRQSLWGSAERPPLVKVLLQYDEAESEDDERHVIELAAQVHDFAAEL